MNSLLSSKLKAVTNIPVISSAPVHEPKTRELRQLKEQLADAHRKIEQERTLVARHKSEASRLKRELDSEVGTDRDRKMGWKGRAEQIFILKVNLTRTQQQDKVKDLENKLEEATEGFDSDGSVVTAMTKMEQIDSRQIQRLRKIEADRRAEVDSSLREFEDLKRLYGEVKQRLDKTRARNRFVCIGLTIAWQVIRKRL